VTGVGVE